MSQSKHVRPRLGIDRDRRGVMLKSLCQWSCSALRRKTKGPKIRSTPHVLFGWWTGSKSTKPLPQSKPVCSHQAAASNRSPRVPVRGSISAASGRSTLGGKSSGGSRGEGDCKISRLKDQYCLFLAFRPRRQDFRRPFPFVCAQRNMLWDCSHTISTGRRTSLS